LVLRQGSPAGDESSSLDAHDPSSLRSASIDASPLHAPGTGKSFGRVEAGVNVSKDADCGLTRLYARLCPCSCEGLNARAWDGNGTPPNTERWLDECEGWPTFVVDAALVGGVEMECVLDDGAEGLSGKNDVAGRDIWKTSVKT